MSAFGPKVQADGAAALPCWIGGHAYLAMAALFFDVRGPDGTVLRRVPLCGEEPVQASIQAAQIGLRNWRGMAAERRAACFAELHSLLERYRGHLAKLIGEECALSHDLADAEVGQTLAAVSGLVAAPMSGAGIAAVLGDALTPLAGPAACTVEALLAGRAVILKPSPKAPSALLALAEIFSRAGFPDGLVNLVHGDEAVVYALCGSEAVTAVACAGGDRVADKVRAIAAETGQPYVGGLPNDELVAAWRRCLGVDD